MLVEGEGLGEVSRRQGPDRERFGSPAVERGGRVQYHAVHHALARSAHHKANPPLRPVQPVLQDPGQCGVCFDQIGQLVEHPRTLPAGTVGVCRKAHQKRAPVRVLDVGKAGESFSDRFRQVAPLHGRRGLIGHRVQAAVPPRPLDEKPRLADPAAPPNDRERSGPRQHIVQPLHLLAAIEELHSAIMDSNIMFFNIIMRVDLMDPASPIPRISANMIRRRLKKAGSKGLPDGRNRGRGQSVEAGGSAARIIRSATCPVPLVDIPSTRILPFDSSLDMTFLTRKLCVAIRYG